MLDLIQHYNIEICNVQKRYQHNIEICKCSFTIIQRNNCKGTFAYLYNITICGKIKEHGKILQHFLEVAVKQNLALFNKNNKCTYSSDCRISTAFCFANFAPNFISPMYTLKSIHFFSI